MALPKVRRKGPDRRLLVALVTAVTLLAGALVYLLAGGSFMSNTPRTDLERDYQMLVQGLEKSPDDASVLMSLAEVEYEMGKIEDAMAHAEKAIEVDPESPYMHTRYAALLMRDGEVDSAIEMLDKEIEISGTTDAEPYFLLGQLYSEKGRHDEAIEAMKAGLEIDNKAADMRIVLGEVYERAGRDKEAIASFKDALQYLPTEQRAIDGLQRLGVSYEPDPNADPHAGTGE